MQTGSVSHVVGQTPLIKLESLSRLTGCNILAKAEYLNPGGSVKDRAAKGIIEAAEQSMQLRPGMKIIEGTAGNTGIGLATLAAQKSYKCTIVMPDNQAAEKYQALEALGVELIRVKPVPFTDIGHFYHTAKKMAEKDSNYFWANQFENPANSDYHFKTTGPEIWQQTQGKIDFFVSATGTGGTIGGVSKYLKQQSANVKVVLADPFGSGMHSYIKNKNISSSGGSITEGIGIMRLTANFNFASIDDAVQVSDQNMINMLYHLAKHDGLLVGTSAALNLFATYQLAQQHQGSNKTFVTIICDSALRYQSRVFSKIWLAEKNLKPTELISI